MTPDNREPRKRRRRRRRAPGAAPDGDAPQGNGNGMPQQGNDQQFGGGGGRRRRRRSRRRGPGGGGGGGAYAPETPLPIDLPAGETMPVGGVLWVKPNGTGLLVQPGNNYVPQQTDAIVPRSVVEKLHLQQGLTLSGSARRAGNNLELVALDQIEGMPMEGYREARRPFSELISIDPNDVFKLETEPERLTTRVLDLLSPLGKGQRCLVVAPPKAGKTTLLKDIAHGINRNHPDVTVIVLLVDERPEEVTDFRRSIERGEVIASSSDETAENHTLMAAIVLDRGLFERRIFPAINIAQTGTRKEEKLLPPTVLPKVHTLRRALAGTDPMNAMKMLLERLQKFSSNEAFLKSF